MTHPPQYGVDSRTARIHKALSPARMAPYLHASGGDVRGALKLYRWNIDLSGSLYESLHVVEVVLRNAMDERLCEWNARQTERSTGRPHGRDWLCDPSPLLRRVAGRDISKARQRADSAFRKKRRGHDEPQHDDILAQLNLATWRYLLPDKDPGKQLLWHEALQLAFPYLTVSERQLVSQVRQLNELRNRVAHLEPMLRSGLVRQEFEVMRAVVRAVDPAMEQWFVSGQRMTAVLRHRPQGGPP